ncbi:RES family NAD+ phosphorylase [Mucilaginibacter segetis]|uniref:RES family NAD+ phosphorylase n=1 Tax=Mucilaginibacter segetis TaxID=2793071 RepID=A0A934ULI2_9SPHI|nr:RES family NAD+ phosphorylase [Mucilaginibacter segetis]MBK0378593.1 RES family NAD+ phosphorylase [Mucilaginibacter segetis]
MYTYRIAQTKYAADRNASGIDGRWNSRGRYVIYTGGSLALSCLEKLVHTAGTSLYAGDFSVTIFNLPAGLAVKEITQADLLKHNSQWQKVINYPITQALGDAWLQGMQTAVLKVPSAIIELEHNYLFNPAHPDFDRIKIAAINKFTFDERLRTKN